MFHAKHSLALDGCHNDYEILEAAVEDDEPGDCIEGLILQVMRSFGPADLEWLVNWKLLLQVSASFSLVVLHDEILPEYILVLPSGTFYMAEARSACDS